MKSLLVGALTLASHASNCQSHADQTIVESAATAGSFQTKGTKLAAVDRVNTPNSAGLINASTPNEEVFSNLPKGPIEDLLRPGNNSKLQTIFTGQVTLAQAGLTGTLMAKTSSKPPSATAPFDAAKAKEHQQLWAQYLGVEVEMENSIGMKLRIIPAGTFGRGTDEGLSPGRKPLHQVTLTKPYMLGQCEVTQDQYQRVMGANPSRFKGGTRPVETVSWKEAIEFCRKLSELPEEKAAGNVYRLPTGAEWEYACRAGTTTKHSFGDDPTELGDYAWYKSNSGGETHPVGSKKPNAFGLHDMHGNVYEWCKDWFGTFPSSAVIDPVGPASGVRRLVRGGAWFNFPVCCESAGRGIGPSSRSSGFGFRVCLTPSAEKYDRQ